MPKTVIIGSNHAGIAAANTLLDQYKDQEVVMIDRSKSLSYLGCGTPLWIGRQIEGYDDLFYTTPGAFQDKGAVIHMETIVERVDYRNRKVYCKNLVTGEAFLESYDHLMLATGSKPIVPQLPGSDLPGIHLMKSFDESVIVDKLLEQDNIKRVAVVGAGYIGVEMVEALKRRGKEVLLFDIQDRVLPGYYDESFSVEMEENLRANGIELHLAEAVKAYHGQTKIASFIDYLDQLEASESLKPVLEEIRKTFMSAKEQVSAIETDQGIYDVDLVINAIGFKPNSDLGKDYLALADNGAYEVDRYQKTTSPKVYAVGDCATVHSNALNGSTYIALASNAVRTGIVAAHNIGGTTLEGPGVQGSNGISIFGLHMVSTGLTLKAARENGFDAAATDYEDWQKPAFMSTNDKVHIRMVYDKATRRVLGTQMSSTGDISMGIHMFSLAIAKQTTIDELKLLDIFFLPHFNQPYNYITMAALGAE